MTSENDISFADRVTKCVLGHYEKCISRRGKPRMEREWTLLAAVVMLKRSGHVRFFFFFMFSIFIYFCNVM